MLGEATENIENTANTEPTDNSDNVDNQEPLNNNDNSNDNDNQEPENSKNDGKEGQQGKKFGTLEDALKGYSELEKKLGQQSNELGELRKQAEEAVNLKKQIETMQLQEAQLKGFDSVKSYQYHKDVAKFTADEYSKHLQECEFPDEMERLLNEYKNNPSAELLDTIESQFSVETLKDVAGKNAIFEGQLQEKENEAQENEIKLSAQLYLNENVTKYAEKFKNPAFAALYGEAFRAYGCNLQTDKFVELMDSFADTVVKDFKIKNGIKVENTNATDEITGLGGTTGSSASGSGKSLTDMSDSELDETLDRLI